MLVAIEKASIKHLDKLCEIEAKCFGKQAFTEQQMTFLLTDSNSVSLISKVKGKVVGFVIGKTHMDETPATGHILTIDVSSEHRRKGVAHQLLKEIESILKDKGVALCFLEVHENNVVALSLYKKLGYKKAETLKNYYENGHGVRFKKVLT